MFDWFFRKEKKIQELEVTAQDIKEFCLAYPGAKKLIEFWENFEKEVAPRHVDYMEHATKSFFKDAIKKMKSFIRLSEDLLSKHKNKSVTDEDTKASEKRLEESKLLKGKINKDISIIIHIFKKNTSMLKEYEQALFITFKDIQKEVKEELHDMLKKCENMKHEIDKMK